jgi:hypothetical protein
VRSAWINSHPAEWTKITDQYSKVAQFNLQNDAEIANFEGENLSDKGISSITSLAKSLGMTQSGFGNNNGFAFGPKKPALPSLKTASTKIPQPKGVTVKKLAAPNFKTAGIKKLSVSKIPSSYTRRKLA